MGGYKVNPGEVWTIPYGQAGAVKQVVILNVFGLGEYVIYLMIQPIRKEKSNIQLTSVGEFYVDARKLSFDHANKLLQFSRSVRDEELFKMRAAAAIALGVDPNAPSDTETRLQSALASVESMRLKITEQQHQLAVYKELCDGGLLALVERLCPSKEPEPPRSASAEEDIAAYARERNARRKTANRARYGALQEYIKVKCKSVGMTFSTLDRLIGHETNCGATGAVSHWARGDSEAHWDELERIFPGLKAEAEAWLREKEATQ